MAEDEDEEGDVNGKRDRITLNPRPATVRYLKQLVATGMYGKTCTTAAGRLIDEGIRLALKDGLVERERDI